MTVTTVAETLPTTASDALCARSPEAEPVHKPHSVCGSRVAQQSWPACHALGTWELRGYHNHYCTEHAAAFLRARAQLDQMRKEAEQRRANARRPR